MKIYEERECIEVLLTSSHNEGLMRRDKTGVQRCCM